MAEEIDTLNRFAVASRGDEVVIMIPPRGGLTKGSALNLAAYLVAIADPGQEEFAPLLKAILNT